MTGNEVAENSGIRRFGQVRRKSEEPAELATRRPEALARLIEKEEHQPRDDGGAPKPTQSGVVTRRYGVREQARCRRGQKSHAEYPKRAARAGTTHQKATADAHADNQQ